MIRIPDAVQLPDIIFGFGKPELTSQIGGQVQMTRN